MHKQKQRKDKEQTKRVVQRLCPKCIATIRASLHIISYEDMEDAEWFAEDLVLNSLEVSESEDEKDNHTSVLSMSNLFTE